MKCYNCGVAELNALSIDNPLFNRAEILRPNVGIMITHHLADFSDQYPWLSLEENGGFSQICDKLHSNGVTQQRFDMRWNRIQPDVQERDNQIIKGSIDSEYLDRSRKIADIGSQKGLENTIVLSSVPQWALELTKTDPDGFRKAYSEYVDIVFSTLSNHGGNPPEAIQIFNELNMGNYTPGALMPHLESCVDIVRNASQKYFQKDIPLEATLQVNSLPLKTIPGEVTGAIPFIEQNQNLLSKFNKIKLDYYPGIWHQPPETIAKWIQNADYFLNILRYRDNPDKLAALNHPARAFVSAFRNMDLLEKTLQRLEPLRKNGLQIGIGEIGVPSIVVFDRPGLDHEKLQTLGIGVVLTHLRSLISKYNLTDIGIYSLMDEPAPEVGAFNWGLYRKDGTPKHVVGKLSQLLKRVAL